MVAESQLRKVAVIGTGVHSWHDWYHRSALIARPNGGQGAVRWEVIVVAAEWARRRTGRPPAGTIRLACLALAVTAAVSGALTGAAHATPPPPPNPSDSSISAAQAAANAKAAQVGQLANQLAQAQTRLADLQDEVELKQEDANKALVDLQAAQAAAARAQDDANSARIAANAAAAAVDRLQGQVDQFVAGSFAQGSTLGSVSAYFDATSAADVLERQRLLSAISNTQLDVLDRMRQARIAQADADSLARGALLAAQHKRADAQQAKQAADAAIAAAVAAQRAQAAQTGQLQNTQAGLQAQLTAAQARVGDLRAQRAQYNAWLAAKQAADARLAAGRGATVRVSGSGLVAAVLRRVLAEVGMPYAWGGGDAGGPTYGIHDGGVADMYGDYNKIGFDCSGLMVYAFAAAGVALPHYSGYQYTAGAHVPISAIQPGDLLFYSFDGAPDGIHHVTMYVGGGEMIEAYESGTTIRVTPVRYYGGLLPYATRVL